MKKHIILFLISVCTIPMFSKCDIKNRVGFDGSLYYFLEPVNFYFTNDKSLTGGIVTDNEYFFLSFYPMPIPEKANVKKIKGNLEIGLANNKPYTLEYYYSNLENDSIFKIVYMIDKKHLMILKSFPLSMPR